MGESSPEDWAGIAREAMMEGLTRAYHEYFAGTLAECMDKKAFWDKMNGLLGEDGGTKST